MFSGGWRGRFEQLVLWLQTSDDEQVIEKVKLSQYSHASTKGESVNNSYSFLTSALDEAELSSSLSSSALAPVPIG
jgi:hypothetical protein